MLDLFKSIDIAIRDVKLKQTTLKRAEKREKETASNAGSGGSSIGRAIGKVLHRKSKSEVNFFALVFVLVFFFFCSRWRKWDLEPLLRLNCLRENLILEPRTTIIRSQPKAKRKRVIFCFFFCFLFCLIVCVCRFERKFARRSCNGGRSCAHQVSWIQEGTQKVVLFFFFILLLFHFFFFFFFGFQNSVQCDLGRKEGGSENGEASLAFPERFSFLLSVLCFVVSRVV